MSKLSLHPAAKKKAPKKFDPAQENDTNKDIILFLGQILPEQIQAVKDLKDVLGTSFRVGLLTNKKEEIPKELESEVAVMLKTNLKRFDKVEKALAPYRKQIAAITCRFENMMPLFGRIVHLFPYLTNPTPQSLQIACDKVEMRKAMKKYAPHTAPKFMLVKDTKDRTIKEIEHEIGFPCVIKPANLSKSKLVSTCYYREELQNTLNDTVKKIETLYKNSKIEHDPKILVEQLIEGKMYSVDGYVNGKGKIYFTPFIEIRTGKDIGYDDFFMYSQMTPPDIDANQIQEAQGVVADAIHSFGLRSSSAHAEMYKTNDGFKIVEIASRVGGFREEILCFAYDIKHYMNDILIHMDKTPILKTKEKQYVVFLKFWPKEPGILKSIKGYKKMCEEKFVLRAEQIKKPGDKTCPAKYGDPPACQFYLGAKTRSELLGNIRKVEKAIELVTEKGTVTK